MDEVVCGYKIVGEAPSSSQSMRRLVFDIVMERNLNGYEGEQMSVEVPVGFTVEEMHAKIRAVVTHRANDKTSIGNGFFYEGQMLVDFTEHPDFMMPTQDAVPPSVVDSADSANPDAQ